MEAKAYSFIGDFDSRADAKNRIVLPAAFKREFEGEGQVRLVIRKDIFEDCLVIYPHSVWDAMMSALRQRLNPYNRQHAKFLRESQRSTCEVQLDGNGRMLVPQKMLELIGADKELTLLGVDDHIELWDQQKMAAQSLTADDLAALSDEIFGNK